MGHGLHQRIVPSQWALSGNGPTTVRQQRLAVKPATSETLPGWNKVQNM
jgi:hypothetical protein